SDTFKGYTLRQFKDVFRRYLGNTPFSSVTLSQVGKEAGFGNFTSVTPKNDVDGSQSTETQ
ncbi:MAG: DUF3631 domain-containing protein, partial [Gammaproteobacteria bacterium]